MTTYWLTFRIHDQTIGGRTYEKRYDDLNKAVGKVATSWWVDSTSFIIFESTLSISQIMTSCKAEIAPSHDLVLIREMDKKSALVTGLVPDQDIFKFMSYLKKA